MYGGAQTGGLDGPILRHRSDCGSRNRCEGQQGIIMSIGTIFLVILILMLVGVLPVWPHASSWGYGPSGIVGVVLVVILVLFLMGRL
jgi:Na+/melibiose symporter-like transporter